MCSRQSFGSARERSDSITPKTRQKREGTKMRRTKAYIINMGLVVLKRRLVSGITSGGTVQKHDR